MISGRYFLGLMIALAGVLCAQNTERVVVTVSVTDEEGRYINDLKSSDFRVFEDDILQKIQTFTTKPQVDPKSNANFYILTYDPNPSNPNKGYRILKVEIVPDVGERWKVRHRPGYRPR